MRKPEDRLNQQLDPLCYGRPGASKINNTEIIRSVTFLGKFHVRLDGVLVGDSFDSEQDAISYIGGFLLGASGLVE